MENNCKNCSKELTCRQEVCNFKSYLQVKNYGEVKHRDIEKPREDYKRNRKKQETKNLIKEYERGE